LPLPEDQIGDVRGVGPALQAGGQAKRGILSVAGDTQVGLAGPENGRRAN